MCGSWRRHGYATFPKDRCIPDLYCGRWVSPMENRPWPQVMRALDAVAGVGSPTETSVGITGEVILTHLSLEGAAVDS